MAKLTKRPDGRYSIQIYLGRDKDGKRKYKTVYGATQKEVQRKADEIRVKLGKGLDLSAQRDTFEKWKDMWLASKTCGAGQLTAYKSCIAHFEPLYGWEIGKIRTCDMQTILNELADSLSQKTLQQTRMSVKQVFRLAIVNRVLDYNPAEALEIPKNAAPPEKRTPISDEQIAWIRNTPHRAQLPAMIMVYCGLRRGEVMALRWNDIDLEKKVLHVRRSVEMIKGQPFEKDGGKTDAAIRDVPIPEDLRNFLSSHKPAPPRGKNVELYPLITARVRSGRIHTTASWDEMWSSFMDTINITHGDFSDCEYQPRSKFDKRGVPCVIETFTAHQLRHTYATLLYEAGIDVITAKYLLGHAKIETTLKIYTHLREQHKTAEITKLDAYLKKNASQVQVSSE